VEQAAGFDLVARLFKSPSSSGKPEWDRRNCQNWVIAKKIVEQRPPPSFSNYPITKFYPDLRVLGANDKYHNGDAAG